MKDNDGWVDSMVYTPYEFEISILKIARDGSIIQLPGWWCGNSWDGRHIKRTDKILGWKRKKEDL